MKKMTGKTKLIIVLIILALVLAGFGVLSAMSYGSLLLAFVSFIVGGLCGGYGKYIYDTYYKPVQNSKKEE